MEEIIINKLMKLADKAFKNNETPISAILVSKGKIIAKAYNKRNKSNLTTSHAEIEVINRANKKLKDWRLTDCALYVTIKPCEMCETVIKESRISEVYYLADRMEYKKQFSKTTFRKLDSLNYDTIRKKYLKKLKSFWKNKR